MTLSKVYRSLLNARLERRLFAHVPGLWMTLFIAVLGAAWPVSVSANMANPYQAGQPVGEPWGSVSTIAIEHERLDLDLRPLANDDPALVTATYQIRNDGQSTTLDLMFVAAAMETSGSSTSSVSLDGQSISSTDRAASGLPASWKSPAATPGLDGQPPLHYTVTQDQAIYFKLPVSTGAHTIKVSYAARATAYSGDSPARYWQLGYVLAPARQWASFGGLDVSVEVPQGWKAATTPALERNGDTLIGTFNQVPADSLALTTQYPASTPSTVGHTTRLAVLGAALLIVILVVLWLIRRRHSIWWALPVGLSLFGIWLIWTNISSSDSNVPSSQAAWTYGYGASSTLLTLLAILLIIVAVATLPILSWRAWRRSRMASSR